MATYTELQQKLSQADKALDDIRAVLGEYDSDPSMSKSETIDRIREILDVQKWGAPV